MSNEAILTQVPTLLYLVLNLAHLKPISIVAQKDVKGARIQVDRSATACY